MNTETLLDMIRNEHRLAVEKHPFFTNRALLTLDEKQAKELLVKELYILDRRIESGDVSGTRVLKCELAEAQAAYSDGDYDHALVELAQCAAVIVRMMEAVKAESEAK